MVLSITAYFFGLSAHAADKCAQDKRELGTKIAVTLKSTEGVSQLRKFEVVGCKNGIYTARDKNQNSTTMQYSGGQGDIRKVRFIGGSVSDLKFQPVITGQWNLKTQKVTFAVPGPNTCGAKEHWDGSMNMCMPNLDRTCPAGYKWDESVEGCMPSQPAVKAPTPNSPSACPAGQTYDPAMGMCMPGQTNQDPTHPCPVGQVWDPSMNMCMAGGDSRKITTMFHMNQFVVLTGSTGPRGRKAVTAPNMWMLMLDKKTSARNTVEVSWMGTTDLWTIPKNGTPELFQAGEANAAGTPFIDAQHPHSSPIMGLTFSDILTYGANGENRLTFFFAPRGEATAGPESFMHRPSAEGNPDAPLGHHLQDVFHISSTVVGAKVDSGKWSIEASAFSGVEPSPSVVNLDMHKPDSFGVRANYRANDNVTIGGSYARVKALDRANNPLQQSEDERAYAAWIQTSHMLSQGKLSTTTLFGRNDNKTSEQQLNSFLEEFLFELGKNNFYGRFELVQRTPEQLEVQVTDGKTGAKWLKAYTLGYERRIKQQGDIKVFSGLALSTYSVPKDFQGAYGKRPLTAKVYLRIKFGRGMRR
jgi:hypothetical protein